MKTAISIPDDLYVAAEKLAERLEKSRSELYAEAVEAYLSRHDSARRTRQLNAVCDAVQTDHDAEKFAVQAGIRRLQQVEWE